MIDVLSAVLWILIGANLALSAALVTYKVTIALAVKHLEKDEKK